MFLVTAKIQNNVMLVKSTKALIYNFRTLSTLLQYQTILLLLVFEENRLLNLFK